MRLSIITVNLNNKAGFEHTLKSVFSQKNRDFESIVIDGLSTDGSRDVISAYQGQIHKWVSEKDSGIFNAMNKGIRLAEGEYVLFLNSGDYLPSPNTMANIFRHDFSEDFIFFDVQLVKKEGSEVRSPPDEPRKMLVLGAICHQAVFHKCTVFQNLGLYDETFKCAADYELFLKAFFLATCSYRVIHETLSVYDCIHGLSSDVKNAHLLYTERSRAQRTVFPPQVVDALEAQNREIELLSGYRSLYEGLMQSGSVRLALRASAVLRRIRRLFGRAIPV